MTSATVYLQGIIKRVKLDGPDRGSGKVDMLPRSVRHRIDDLIDDVSCYCFCRCAALLLAATTVLPLARCRAQLLLQL